MNENTIPGDRSNYTFEYREMLEKQDANKLKYKTSKTQGKPKRETLEEKRNKIYGDSLSGTDPGEPNQD